MHETLEELLEEVKKCKKCDLCSNKENLSLGIGNSNAKVVFIGEGLKDDIKEDKLFEQALKGIGIKKEEIYYTNIIKCKITSRKPLKEEINMCLNYLRNQVVLINPKVIVLLGNTVLESILGEEYNILKVRGNWIEKKSIKYMTTFSIEELIKDENKKVDFWNDLKLVLKEIKNTD